LQDLHPERRLVQVDAEPIFRNGGGVHCITQQEPDVAGTVEGETPSSA
jgi:agmatine deiminase